MHTHTHTQKRRHLNGQKVAQCTEVEAEERSKGGNKRKGGQGGRREGVGQAEDKIYEEQVEGGIRDMIEQSKQGRTNKLFEDTNRMINR